MSDTGLKEDGSPQSNSPQKRMAQTEDAWMPPLRIGDFQIRDSPYKHLTRSGSKRQARSSVLQQQDQSTFHQKVEKLKARHAALDSPRGENRGLARLGALTARQERKKAEPSPRRPQTSRKCPGALGWLYREPEADDHRMNDWILSNPAPECMLRQALRTPLSVSSPRDVSQTVTSSSLSTVANDICEKHTQHVGALVKEVGRYRPEETPVLEAGRKRVQRIKQFVAEELQLMEEEKAAAEEALALQRQLTPEEVDAPVVFTCSDLALDTAASTCSRSRGTSGLASSESGFTRLMVRCQEVLTVERPTTPSIAALLVQDAETEEQKAWAIFCWLCLHVHYEPAGPTEPVPVLRSRQASAAGFAQLFAELCIKVGLQAEVVSGHVCSYASEQTEDVCNNEENRHAWNAVQLAGTWTLVDCAFGAGFCGRGVECVKSFRPYYFGPEPEDLAYTHFPSDPQFQLLTCPLDYKAFLEQPQVNPEVFFGLNMSFHPEQRSVEAMPQLLGGTNAGVVMLKVPRNVRVMASVDGDESLCFMSPVARKTRLRVTVISASRLQNSDLGGYDRSDPFCKIEIKGKPEHSWQTKVIKDSLNPKWNESFEINECLPGDKLHFSIFDEDFTTDHDLLGSYDMSTTQFHAGQDFAGEVDLEEDGALRSKLKLQVEVLSSAAKGSRSRNGSAEPELMALHFCTQSQPRQQRLEVQARRTNASVDLFRRACSWTIEVPTQLQDFLEPRFPRMQEDVIKKYGVDFYEAWPVGYFDVQEQEQVKLRFCVPSSMQAMADVDGNRSYAFVQPSPAADGSMEVRAQIPEGAHDLNVYVKPSGADSEFEHAITYRMRSPAVNMSLPIFPETTALFHDARARLEEPLMGRLCPGLVHFAITLNAECSDLHLMSGGITHEHLHVKKSGAKGGRRASALPQRTWAESLYVYEPEATLLCSVRGEVQPLLHWAVAPEPSQ